MNKVCVLMTSYNPTEYLFEQIGSVLTQENVEVNIVLRDDCSPNKTNLYVARDKYNITVIEGSVNLGVAGNIGKLLEYANEHKSEYDFFAYADQDDVWMPDKLSTACAQLAVLDSNKPCLYYSNLLVVDEKLTPSHELFKRGIINNTPGQSLTQVFLFACTSAFNAKMVEALQGIDFSVIGFDSCLYYMGILCGDCYYDDKPRIKYRQHGNNVSGVKHKGIKYIFEKIGHIGDVLGEKTFQGKAKFVFENYNIEDKETKQMFESVAEYKTFGDRLKIIKNKKIRAGYYPKDFYNFVKLLLNAF